MPKTYYCWRCKMPIPMLTDEEWAEVQPLLEMDIDDIKRTRIGAGMGLREAIDARAHRSCQRYFEITGVKETNPNALWHHRLSVYGPECQTCGHLFRTPHATFCANCGSR